MKITKRQLRRIIREAIDVVNIETGEVIDFGEGSTSGIPDSAVSDLFRRLRIDVDRYASDENEYTLPDDAWRRLEDETLGKQEELSENQRPWGSYAKKSSNSYSDVITMSPNGDSVLVDGEEVYVQNVPQQLELMGFPMSDTDADNLIFALEDQFNDGYVELQVTYENGKWSW